MVLDTSAVLAIFFGEKHGAWCAKVLDETEGPLRMSTVNLAECLILIEDRSNAEHAGQVETALLERGVAFIAPDVEQARIAASARHRFPLNLGDCFAYALATVAGDAVLTLDRDFNQTDLEVVSPPTR